MMAERPSGAVGSRNGSKLVSSTSTARFAPWTKLIVADGTLVQALNEFPTKVSASALVSAPSSPRSGFQVMFRPPLGQRKGTPSEQFASGPPASAGAANNGAA